MIRGWWADRVQVWRARKEWKRRLRALAAARAALDVSGPLPSPVELPPVFKLAIAFVLAVAVALAFAGCSTEGPLELDAGTPDAGADVTTGPQCTPLQPGDLFEGGTSAAGLPVLINNAKCDRVCRNTAGGATCINATTLQLVNCEECAS